jgi:hypothetical protein
MSTNIVSLRDGNSLLFEIAVEQNANNIVTPHSVPEINGLPVTNANPLPTAPVTSKLTAYGPNANFVAVGGTPVVAFSSNTLVNGCWIKNPPNASANLLVDPVNATPSATNGTTSVLVPGQLWVSPGALTGAIYVVSSDNNHYFEALGW